MISEKNFIKNYTGFWNSIFPFQIAFIKGVTLECSQCQKDIGINTTGRRLSFISEVGFQIFALCTKAGVCFDQIAYDSDLYQQVEEKCANKFKLFPDDDQTIREPLDTNEFNDAMKIAQSLNMKFKEKDILVNPKFLGCSIIDTCYGDVLANDTLYEVKTVSRNFNIMDFRQLTTYCALNYSSKQYNIKSIGLYNPKRKISYKIDLEVFASVIAGSSPSDIFWAIINFISHDDTSK